MRACMRACVCDNENVSIKSPLVPFAPSNYEIIPEVSVY